MAAKWFRFDVLLPAAVFQAVLVGPGYGTGREVMEFITPAGATGGLLTLLIVTLVFWLVLFLTFEISRVFRAYDYRGFFLLLLGRYWILYELLFLSMLVLILAVSTSAAGEILKDKFGLPYMIGASLVLVGIILTNYYGRRIVELTLTYGMVAFSTVILLYVGIVISREGETVFDGLGQGDVESGWLVGGLKFAIYNCCTVPALLYATRGLRSKGDVVVASLFAAVFGAFPALVFHVAFIAGYPDVLEQPLPTYWMIQQLNVPLFFTVYVLVLFVMIVQTGVGILQGVNERLDAFFSEERGKILSRRHHATVAAAIFMLSLGLSIFGIINLVAKGYGGMAWGLIIVYILPLLTRGLWLLFRGSPTALP